MPACKSAGWGISITADKRDDIISGRHRAAGYPDVAIPLSHGAFTWPAVAHAHHITAQGDREDG